MADDLVHITWHGLREVEHDLERIAVNASRGVRRGVSQSALLMKREARRRAPIGPRGPRTEGGQDRHPGFLRKSISYSRVREVGTGRWQTYVRARAPYAPKIERLRSFMRPAFDEAAGAMPEIIQRHVRDAIR